MNSKDAARLAFGNPGFFDFLKPIGGMLINAVAPGFTQSQALVRALQPVANLNPITSTLSNLATTVGDIAQKAAATIVPGVSSIISADEDDDPGAQDDFEEESDFG
jgi:hypothetical protein